MGSVEARISDLSSQWAKYRRAIQIRLDLSGQFSTLLQRASTDDYQFHSMLDRLSDTDPVILDPFRGAGRPLFHESLLATGELDHVRQELLSLRGFLEDRQDMARQLIDKVTAGEEPNIASEETVQQCQVLIRLNADRLDQLRDRWTVFEGANEQYRQMHEQWLELSDSSRRLDEKMVASLARISRSPAPVRVGDCEISLREHLVERDLIDQLVLCVSEKARKLGRGIGEREATKPDASVEQQSVWQLFEYAPDSEPTDTEVGLSLGSVRRMRSELRLHLAGLETRWKAWERAWSSHRQMLERRSNQLSRLSTIEVSLHDIFINTHMHTYIHTQIYL
ncbi:unnamed protein product [Protopolystoma xenopodis]|uniref:Uncharacterized protein n=1 Tax=Protopolystoma xenopodis TaxID=117903 RepID=A0A3S5ARS9_9PLAT|nr:unnamed protein product [Protopolystoma xenopodis]